MKQEQDDWKGRQTTKIFTVICTFIQRRRKEQEQQAKLRTNEREHACVYNKTTSEIL
jgi:DNA/RNA-binding domain of Phe-tRNA-synthetase-like protein